MAKAIYFNPPIRVENVLMEGDQQRRASLQNITVTRATLLDFFIPSGKRIRHWSYYGKLENGCVVAARAPSPNVINFHQLQWYIVVGQPIPSDIYFISR